MVDIVRQADSLKKSKGGRKNKRNLEDQLLVTLKYLREDHTYFHIGQTIMALVNVKHIKLLNR